MSKRRMRFNPNLFGLALLGLILAFLCGVAGLFVGYVFSLFFGKSVVIHFTDWGTMLGAAVGIGILFGGVAVLRIMHR